MTTVPTSLDACAEWRAYRAAQPHTNGRARIPAERRKRREELLPAAARIIAERGYADASIQDIAQAMGMLKSSIYHYIESKELLLAELMEQYMDEVETLWDEVASRDELSPVERLAYAVFVQARHNAASCDLLNVWLHNLEFLSEERRAIMRTRTVASQTFLLGLIKGCQAAGQADASQNPNLVADFLIGSVASVARWYRPDSKYSPDEVAQACTDFVMMGAIGERPAGSPAQ